MFVLCQKCTIQTNDFNYFSYFCPSMKKVLIITYYWEPAGGPGVQRWVKFVKYLRHFGIEPIVYAPENPHYPIIDAQIAQNQLPKDITVIKRPILEPYAWAKCLSAEKTNKISAGILPKKKISLLEKLMLWVRGNFFIPDARVLWVKPSVRFLQRYISENEIDTVITTGPPHSMHLIGLGLKQKLKKLRWIADFRDPWVNIGYHSSLKMTPKSTQKHIFLERKVLHSADEIIVTSPSTQREFAQKTPQKIHLIPNGFDDEPIKSQLSPKFWVSHIGSLLSERNPTTLWRVFADLTRENSHFAADFVLCLAGKVSPEVLQSLEEVGLMPFLDLKGYVSHNEAISLQKSSQLLLLLEINHPKTAGIIPGKLFEYLNARRPILALGYADWDAKNIIEATHAGKAPLYDDYQQIKSAIEDFYTQYKNGTLHVSPQNIGFYHRKNLTKILAQIIKKNKYDECKK